MRPYSLSRRLISTVLLVQLVASICVLVAAYFYERHIHFRTFEIMLRGRADSLLGAVQDAEDPGDNVMLDGTEISLPRDDIYEVKDATGRLLGRSSNWSGFQEGTELDHEHYFSLWLQGSQYRGVRLTGTRIVDPGDKGGGIPRSVVIYYGAPTGRVWKAIHGAINFFALSSLAVLIVTGLLMGWLLHRGLEPLQQLAASASRVSAVSWAFQPPERARATRELVPLVTALETLLQGLELSFAQQKRFVGDAAHELKTAVTVVKSSLQLLGMRHRTSEEYEAGITRALEDCQRMEGIVAQMLTLASIEETVPSDDIPWTDLAASVQAVFHDLATAAEIHQMHFDYRGPEVLQIRVPSDELKLLCGNILLNALQHSPAGSSVIVQANAEAGMARIDFIDHGEGIPPEDQQRIFERFGRSDVSRSRKTGGTGLGLAICKAIAEKYRGSIAIASRPNEGTTITVHLPCEDTHTTIDAVKPMSLVIE